MGTPVETIQSLSARLMHLENLVSKMQVQSERPDSPVRLASAGIPTPGPQADHQPLEAALSSIAGNIKRIADKLDPPPSDVIGSPYIAKHLGQTTTWVAEMARNGTIPQGCLVPGTGNGKPWKFYRSKIDDWLKTR